jgi:cell division transport system ATP-binding protein
MSAALKFLNKLPMDIRFNNVTKKYGLIVALSDITFSIPQGQFVFIAGPSGAGKTTLLKLILAQIKPSFGNLEIGGIDFGHSKRHEIEKIRRKIGVIFQDYQLIPDKTIEENIALALDIISYPKNNILPKIDDVIKKVNLSTRRYLYPSQLSGGELQRASLARALAIEPNIILADEPTGNLDLENTWHLIKLLKKINETTNTTIIMTTHNTDIIDSLDKRTLYLRDGMLEKDITNSIAT